MYIIFNTTQQINIPNYLSLQEYLLQYENASEILEDINMFAFYSTGKYTTELIIIEPRRYKKLYINYIYRSSTLYESVVKYMATYIRNEKLLTILN